MIKNMIRSSTNLHTFSKEIIKPSYPTPQHLKTYNLSIMDKLLYRNYIPLVLFFPSSAEKVGEKLRQLKHSLSETLTAYYPFAGSMVKSRAYVDCNDDGVEFQESEIKCTLPEYLEKYEEDHNRVNMIFPPGSVWSAFDNNSNPMIVRVNYFDCGGIAVAVCASHRIADSCTLANFLNYWGAVSRQSGEQILPHIVSSPWSNDGFAEPPLVAPDYSLTRKRFVFKNTELAKLKAKVCSSDGQNPTRLEFLTALFYKCCIAVDIAKTGSFQPSLLFLPINMRLKMDPQLPKTTLGNWIYREDVEIKTESELQWSSVLDGIKKSKKNVEGMKELNGIEMLTRFGDFAENNYKFYNCSSLCSMNLYNVNFGWGNPVQIVLADAHYEDSFTLFDIPTGDGIEVLTSFHEQELLKNQIHKELHALASFD
jgi:shikimate O-hydroxycinnamoyltransferase